MNVEIFLNKEFGEIRGSLIDDVPYFVAKDIAVTLGYVDTKNAIKRHCKGVAKYHPLQTSGGMQDVRVINESDVYRLVFGSKLESAVKFESWVVEEVLPSIRKHGAYMTPQKLEEAEKKYVKIKPKADYAEAVIGTDNPVSIRDWINTLKSDRGLKVGEREVVKMLIEKKMLYRNTSGSIRAFAKYSKFFSLMPLVITSSSKSTEAMQVKVTGSGQVKVGDRVVKYFNEERVAEIEKAKAKQAKKKAKERKEKKKVEDSK